MLREIPDQQDLQVRTGLRELTVQKDPPEHTLGYRAVTDLARKQVVLFGYGDLKDQWRAQTWTFDGKDWKLLHKWGAYYPEVAHSDIWHVPRVVHDAARDEFVLIGAGQGQAGKGFVFSTWVMRNDRYIKKTPKTVPAFRFPLSLCYHSGMKTTVMFGGEVGEPRHLTRGHGPHLA